jgi:MFS family permease
MARINYGVTSWFSAAFGYFLQNGLLVLPAVLLPALHKSLGFTSAEVGMFSAAFLFTFTVAQIPVGVLFDRYSSRMLICASYFLMMLGCLVFAISDNLYDALLGRMLMGFAAAFTFIGALYLSRSWFDKEAFSAMVGFTEAMSGIGSFLLNMIFVALNYFFHWRGIMFGLVVLLTIFSAAAFYFVRDNYRVRKVYVNVGKELVATLRNKRVWLISIYGFLSYSHYIVIIMMWGTPFMADRYHLKEFNALLMNSSCIFGYILGCVLLGKINKYYSVKEMIFYAIIAQTVLYVFLIFFRYPAAVTFIFEFVIGIMTSHVMLIFVLAENHLPKNITGIATGFINTFLLAVGIVMIPITGKIYDEFHSILIAVIPVLICQLLAIPFAVYFNYSKEFESETV